MELTPRLLDAINKQINAEVYSAYVYLSMSAHFDAINMPGFASWMRAQHEEEMSHAMKLFDFVNDRDSRVVLQAIEQRRGRPCEHRRTPDRALRAIVGRPLGKPPVRSSPGRLATRLSERPGGFGIRVERLPLVVSRFGLM